MVKTALLTLVAVSTMGLNTVMANNINYDLTYSQPNVKGYIKVASIGNINDIKGSLEKLGIDLNKINLANCTIIPNWQGGSNPTIPEIPTQKPENNIQQSEFAQQVVNLVNQERAKAGLTALSVDNNVANAALTRAKEIEKSFSHTRPNGSNFSTALTEQGVKFLGSGENIAWGQTTPEQVMKGWMNSPGHRANIMNPKFKYIGVGHHQNSNGVNYWTQLFTY